jgi:hypothetical protein
MILRAIDTTMLRLAFPIRSEAVRTLTDTTSEDRDLRALQAITWGQRTDNARTYLEAPFRYPASSRFSDGTFGVLYAANSLVTSIRETAYHLSGIYADGRAPAMQTRRKQLALRLIATSVDVRRAIDTNIDVSIYDTDSYQASQTFGAKAREQAPLLHFDSVRNVRGGHCIGAFSSHAVQRVRFLADIALVWDGQRFVEEHEIRAL